MLLLFKTAYTGIALYRQNEADIRRVLRRIPGRKIKLHTRNANKRRKYDPGL